MKKPLLIILGVIIIAGAILMFLRFVVGGDEDTWVCSNGVWVKHGNPSAVVPTTGCGIKELSCESISNQAECQKRVDCLPVDSCVCTTDYEKSQRCHGTPGMVCDCYMGGFERCTTLVCDDAANTNTTINTNNSNSVHIDNDFNSKVVYITGASSAYEITAFENDCRLRRGTFNTCGSPCEPGASICASVCAYTCDNIPE